MDISEITKQKELEQQKKETAENLTLSFIEIADEFLTVSDKLIEFFGSFVDEEDINKPEYKQLKEKTIVVHSKLEYVSMFMSSKMPRGVLGAFANLTYSGAKSLLEIKKSFIKDK
jgi:hypothetical protein